MERIIISVAIPWFNIEDRSKVSVMRELDELFKKRERQWIIRNPSIRTYPKFVHRVLVINKSYNVVRQFEV